MYHWERNVIYIYIYVYDSCATVVSAVSKPADTGAAASSVTGTASAAGNTAAQSSFCYRGISVPLLVNISAPSGSQKTI